MYLVLVVLLLLHLNLVLTHSVMTETETEITTIGSMRVLSFPAQKKLHFDALELTVDPSKALSVDEFMNDQLSLLYLSKEDVQKEREENLSNGLQVLHYQQFVQGIPVYGGVIILQVGRHGGVIKASGSNILAHEDTINLNPTPTVQSTTVTENLATYIRGKYALSGDDDIKIDKSQERLVFYRENLGSAKLAPGNPFLANYIKGSTMITVDGSNKGVVFDAFIDSNTGRVVDVLVRID